MPRPPPSIGTASSGNAPKRPFEAVRLFRWRNYQDYGTGVAGDLFVHLLSGLHFATGSIGPDRILATGGLRYWNDGRDVPDVMLAMLDYAQAADASRVHDGAAGQSQERRARGAVRLPLHGQRRRDHDEHEFPAARKGRAGARAGVHDRDVPESHTGRVHAAVSGEISDRRAKTAAAIEPEKFAPPQGYDAHREHHRVFYEAVRSRKRPVEDAVFGFRAAGPALLANTSYFEKRMCHWDPQAMAVRGLREG